MLPDLFLVIGGSSPPFLIGIQRELTACVDFSCFVDPTGQLVSYYITDVIVQPVSLSFINI